MNRGVNRSQKNSICVDFHQQWQFSFNEDLFLHHKACFEAKTQNSCLEFLYTYVSVCALYLPTTQSWFGIFILDILKIHLTFWRPNFKKALLIFRFTRVAQREKVTSWKIILEKHPHRQQGTRLPKILLEQILIQPIGKSIL